MGTLRIEVLSDSQTLVEFTVTNVGTMETGIIKVMLPLYTLNIETNSPAIIPSLQPGESYTVSLLVTTNPQGTFISK